MKCTVKEMIDYLSSFPPDSPFEITSAGIIEPEGAVLICGRNYFEEICIGEWDEKLPELPLSLKRNKSLEYTEANYSD